MYTIIISTIILLLLLLYCNNNVYNITLSFFKVPKGGWQYQFIFPNSKNLFYFTHCLNNNLFPEEQWITDMINYRDLKDKISWWKYTSGSPPFVFFKSRVLILSSGGSELQLFECVCVGENTESQNILVVFEFCLIS